MCNQYARNKRYKSILMGGSLMAKCLWCNKDVYNLKSNTGELFHNTATIDHIYSKNDLRRYLVKDRKNVVLACHECNHHRNAAEIKALYADYNDLPTVSIIEMLL